MKKKIILISSILLIICISIAVYESYIRVNSIPMIKPVIEFHDIGEKYFFEGSGNNNGAKGCSIKINSVRYLTQEEMDEQYPEIKSDKLDPIEKYKNEQEYKSYVIVNVDIKNETNDEEPKQISLKFIQLDYGGGTELASEYRWSSINPTYLEMPSPFLSFLLMPQHTVNMNIVYSLYKDSGADISYFNRHAPNLVLEDGYPGHFVRLPRPDEVQKGANNE